MMTFGSYNELKQMDARNRPTIINATQYRCFLNVNDADARKLQRLSTPAVRDGGGIVPPTPSSSHLPLCYNCRNPEAMC